MKFNSEHKFHHRKSEMKEMMTQSNSHSTHLLSVTCNPSRVLINVLACLLLLALPMGAGAQTIHLSYGQQTLGTYAEPSGIVIDKNDVITVADVNGLHGENNYFTEVTGSAVNGVAVDWNRNLFTVLGNNLTLSNHLTEFSPGCYIDSCSTQLSTQNLSNISGMAVNNSGSVFVSSGASVYVISSPYSTKLPLPQPPNTIGKMGQNLNNPGGLAVDANGNLWVADAGPNPYVTPGLGQLYEVTAASNYTATGSMIATIGGNPSAVAITGSGNFYITDSITGLAWELYPDGSSRTLGGGFVNPIGVAVDSRNNVFVLDTKPSGSLILGTLYEVFGDEGDFGSVIMGRVNGQAVSNTHSLYFYFDEGGTLGAITALTGGATGLDFTIASTSTCIAGHTYAAGQECTVDVTFGPQLSAGLRKGALVIKNASGTVIATTYLHGIGVAAQVSFLPGTKSTLGGGFNMPIGVAVDGKGNIFVADAANNAVKEILAPSYTTVNTLGSGFLNPQGIAVDGAGNVLVADTGNSEIKQILAAGGYTTVNKLASGSFGGPMGVAVDGSGNVFVSDGDNNAVKEILAPGYTTVNTLASGLSFPAGVAVDGIGNVYVADSGDNKVFKLDYADPPTLSFATPTAAGTVDSTDGEQTATVQNIGNQPLTFGNIFTSSYVGGIPQKSSSFTIDSSASTACASTLAAGTSCTLSVGFDPTGAGASISGWLWVQNNTLVNEYYSPSNYPYQQINLQGSGGPQTINFPNPGPVTYGVAPITLAATASSGLAVSYNLVSGPAQLNGNTLTITGAGSVTVQANQAGNSTYSPAPTASVTITVNQATPTVTFTGAPASAKFQSQFMISATTNASTAAVITASGACTIAGTTVTMTASTGMCSLNAAWAADANYLAGNATQSTTASPGTPIAPTVAFTGAPVSAAYKSTFVVSATTNASTAAVITASGSCTIAGATVTITKSTGTCSLKAAWPADTNYIAATATQSTTATGIPPYLSTSTLAFGNEGVGVPSASRTVYVYNYTGSPVNAQIPASTGPFAVAGGTNCPNLAANATCNFTVTFTPPSTGVVPATPLNVVVGGVTTLPLTATGAGVTAALTLSPTTVNFGVAGVGTTKTAGFTLYNYTGSTATINSITTGMAVYAVGPDNCTGQTLGVDKSCSFTVGFTPATAGATGPVLLTVNSTAGTPTATLTGTGK